MKEFIETMEKKDTGVTLRVAEVLNFVGGVSGVLALLTIVFYGGAMVEKVKSLDVRVSTIETTGSVTLKQHVASDDMIQRSIQDRIQLLESLLVVVHRTESKVEGMIVKLDGLKEQLAKHETDTRKP